MNLDFSAKLNIWNLLLLSLQATDYKTHNDIKNSALPTK